MIPDKFQHLVLVFLFNAAVLMLIGACS